MPTYDPSGHALLSNDAGALADAELDAQAEVAEDVLGLEGTSFTGAKASRATLAVVRQVNLQVATPVDAAVKASESRGNQNVAYRESEDGRPIMVDPVARRLANRLLTSDGWTTATGVR